MRYYLIAGEASGDLHGSNLMKNLIHKDPDAKFRFWGGDLMKRVGGEIVKHYQDLAFMRRMFNVARREWKWTRDNPVADLSFSVGTSNARDRWFSFEEEDQLLESASPEWLARVIIFALQTGMRRSGRSATMSPPSPPPRLCWTASW